MKSQGITRGRAKPHERGNVLVIATLVVVVMALMAVPFLFKLSGQQRSTERGARALTAFNLAEAGVDKVMWELDPYHSPQLSDPEAIVWDFSGANDVGVISGLRTGDGRVMGNVQVVLTQPIGGPPNPLRRNLDSTGLVPFIAANTVDRTVRVTLEQYWKSIFDVGFFVDEYFYIRNSYLLDAYDSRDGDYGAALPDGGTNSHLPDVYFGSNSYMSDPNPNNPAEATWVIESGGGSSEVYGTVMAGGDAAEAYNNGTGDPPDPSIIEEVINVPREDIFLGDQDRMVMNQEYNLPPVDVFDLPPKDMLGSIPSVGDWFPGYDADNPESSAGYYPDRFDRAPLQTEIGNNATGVSADRGTFSGSGTLGPEDSGVYTSFVIGGNKTPGTLNIEGGDVVIYVTSFGDVTAESGNAASFYMGPSSNINIAPDSSLTLILGNASVTIEQGYNINAQGSPPQAANCVILGTNQFTVPPTQDVRNLPNKASTVDNMRIPGLMYFEHAQSDGNIYSAMYIPGGHITTGQGQNHMNLYGALIAKSMEFKVQVDFHYDKALGDMNIIKGGFDFWMIINWVEVVGGN